MSDYKYLQNYIDSGFFDFHLQVFSSFSLLVKALEKDNYLTYLLRGFDKNKAIPKILKRIEKIIYFRQKK